MTLNIDITAQDDGSFLARIREYAGCWASGPTQDAAVDTLLEMLPDYLEAFHGMGEVQIESLELDDDDAGAMHRALVLA